MKYLKIKDLITALDTDIRYSLEDFYRIFVRAVFKESLNEVIDAIDESCDKELGLELRISTF